MVSGDPYRLGFRHPGFLRFELGRGPVRCQLVGIGHRLPREREIPLATAVALAAQGFPTVVRDRSPEPSLSPAITTTADVGR